MPDPNTGTVILDFKDAHRKPIKDSVRVTFDNFNVKSFNFRKTFDTFPVTLKNVPAFPTGRWQVFVQPEKYRPKSFFVHLGAGETKTCEEFFFLHASKARAVLPSTEKVFSEAIWSGLAALLKKSTIEKLKGPDLYADLIKKKNHTLAAGLLNLHGRTQAVTLESGKTAFDHLESVGLILQDRIYAAVGKEMHSDVLKSVKKKILDPANGSLHEFPIPGNYVMLKKDVSFKTPEKSGNLQLTFAENPEGKRAVDADVDEAKGIQHAFEVIGHKFTGARTHPYDIHQILTFFYPNIDLGYDVVPA
jgi:hypothetical protein